MKELGIITNASYVSQGTLNQIARYTEEAERLGAKVYCYRTDRPWAEDCNTYFPKKCIYLDKDVAFARYLEKRGIRLFNSASATELADNKIFTQVALSGTEGIAFPKTTFAPKRYFGRQTEAVLDEAERELGYPMVVKEAYGSLGEQVYIALSREELDLIAAKIGAKEHLYQQFVKESNGRSIRVFIVGDKAVAAARFNNPNDFRSNVEHGGSVSYADIDGKFCLAAVRAAKKMGLDIAAVDFFDAAEPMLIEVNSNAFFHGLETIGVNLAAQIVSYILDKK